jgi:tetratricopeptide (TPR) repeat protein
MADRLMTILKMLEKTPGDAFLLYGAALEYKKAEKFVEALDYLNRAIAIDENFCYAYYQKGQVLEEQGDNAAAAGAYRDGIVAAERANDQKALGELSGALSIIE